MKCNGATVAAQHKSTLQRAALLAQLTKAQAVFPQQCGPLCQRRMGSTCKQGLWPLQQHGRDCTMHRRCPQALGEGQASLIVSKTQPNQSRTREVTTWSLCWVCSRSWTRVPGSASSPVLVHTLLEPGGQQLTSPCTYESKGVWWAALQAAQAQANVIWHSKFKPSFVSGWKKLYGHRQRNTLVTLAVLWHTVLGHSRTPVVPKWWEHVLNLWVAHCLQLQQTIRQSVMYLHLCCWNLM